MPFSAVTRESLEYLGPSFSVLRFRVNFVFAGAPAFSEEGEYTGTLTLAGRAIRDWKWRIICLACAVDPETGIVSTEPLVRLSRERGRNGAVTFGVLFGADCEGKTYEIRVGDRVQLKE
jgi:uncharacterized protein YcbX